MHPFGLPGAASLSEPGELLDPAHELVGFTGRGAELKELAAWRDGSAVGVRLLHGPAGQGKTRLAYRFAETTQADGWHVSLAYPENGPATTGSRAAHLVIVDGADRWPVSRLLDLLGDANLYGPGGTCFLLLSRSAGDWWRSVAARAGLDCTRQRLGPLATQPAERELLYLQAAAKFADALDREQGGEIPLPDDLDGLDSVLAMHLAALSTVYGTNVFEQEPEPRAKYAAILSGPTDSYGEAFAAWLAARDRWCEGAAAELLETALPLLVDTDLPALPALLRRSPTIIGYAHGAVLSTLAGRPAVGIDLLQAFDAALGAEPGVDFEAGAATVARRLVGELLRGTRDLDERAALYDRLGGRLLIPGHYQDASDAYDHAADVRRQLLRRDDDPVRRSELAQSLAYLGRAQCALKRWNEARRSLQEALRIWLQLRREAYFAYDLSVARCYETLAEVFDGLRSDREAFAARQYATGILRNLAANGTVDVGVLAVSLADLAERYLRRGAYLDAAFRAAEAVSAWPDRADPRFAALLIVRGRALWQAGRYDEAGADLNQAVAVLRSLGDDQVSVLTGLAEAATLLGHVRRVANAADALPPYAEAIGYRKRLLSVDSGRWPDLASAYIAFAWACYDSRRRLDEALTAVIDACMLYHGADSGELREARALGVQLLEALGRGPEADRIREWIDERPEATDRQIFAMVLNRQFAAAAEALNAMEPGRAVHLIVLCGPMAAMGLRAEGLDEALFEGARRHDPVAFTELARLTRRPTGKGR